MRDYVGVIVAGLSCSESSPPDAAGPPLVLVHGAGGTHEHWPAEVRTLPGRRVLALDLPGHGGAPGPALTSIGAHARAVLALLDALRVPAAVLAGHSMGGAIALTVALDAPSRVAGLALVGTGARLRVSPAVLQATADPAALAAGAETMADFAFGALAGEELRRAFVAGMLACPPGVAHGDFAACDVFDVMARLAELRAPTLVVCGSEDRLTPPKYSQFLRDHIAGARLELVPGAGHLVMLEAPARVAAALEGFLASLAPPR
jgi:pimeloyl-ACP methyl ester carboxylesterase